MSARRTVASERSIRQRSASSVRYTSSTTQTSRSPSVSRPSHARSSDGAGTYASAVRAIPTSASSMPVVVTKESGASRSARRISTRRSALLTIRLPSPQTSQRSSIHPFGVVTLTPSERLLSSAASSFCVLSACANDGTSSVAPRPPSTAACKADRAAAPSRRSSGVMVMRSGMLLPSDDPWA